MSKLLNGITERIPSDHEENLKWRVKFYHELAQNTELAAAAKRLFYQDPVFAFKAFFWTYDPRPSAKMHKLPFCLYDFQIEVLYDLMYAIERGHDLVVMKSRDLGISWLVCTAKLWYWLRPESGWDFLLGSRKEEYVDRKGNINTLFEKIRYNLYRIPKFLRPVGFEPSKNDLFKMLTNPESGNVIAGEANNANFGTSGRFRAVLLDEFSKWQGTDYDAWTSLADVTPCRIAVSSPWGRGNKFADLVTGGEEGIKVLKLHWSLHPDKDDEWFENEKKRRSPMEIAQELELSLEGSAGERFFSNFNPSIHVVKQPEYVPGREVMVGFDFGYHHPALVSAQLDDNDRLVVQHCILGREIDVATFAEYCWKRLQRWYPNCDNFSIFADIAGNQRSDKASQTSIEILRDKFDAPIYSQKIDRAGVNERLREMLNNLINGEPEFKLLDWAPGEGYQLPEFVDREDNDYIKEGFLGGIHYPSKRQAVKEDWVKDGYFEHGFDAIGFIIAARFLASRPGHRAEILEKTRRRNELFLRGGQRELVRQAWRRQNEYRQAAIQRLRANRTRLGLHQSLP